jgi:ATP/ADP translocase
MTISHLTAMLLFAFLVSVVFGVLSKDTPRERLIYGAKVFAAFVGVALLLGWIMYPVPW